MKFFRSHIARLFAIVWLGASLGLFVAQTVQAHQSPHEFTRWLSSMAETTDTVDLEKELDDLKTSSTNLDELISRASQIVSRNNEDFKFPIPNSTASQQIYQLLFLEWTQFQTGNEMAAVPTHKVVKTLLNVSTDHQITFGGTISSFNHLQKRVDIAGSPVESQVITAISIDPMSDGIAIHAP